jgi:tetratricopeptide (TPR) repeat protein
MKLSKILKYCIYAVAFIPLIIFSQYVSPFHFGKMVVFRSVVELMFALYLILIWQDRSYLPRRDKFFWAFLGFTLAYTITTFTSVNVYQSFWGTLERMGGLYSFWHYFLFYVMLISVLRTKEDWTKFLEITVGVGVLSALYGFGQRTDISFFIGSGGRERIFGTIGNPALFAGYQILNFFLAMILGLTATEKGRRNLFLISAFVMGIAVFMTVVRGSVLGISVGMVIFVFLYFTQTNSKLAKKVLISLLTLTVLFIGFSFSFRDSAFVQNSPYLRRVTDFSVSDYTVQTRFWAWQAGLKGWSDNPQKVIFGWGPENFNIPFSKYFNPQFFRGPGSETMFDRAHNMFVEVLVTMGLVGFLAYLFLFAVIFKSLWRLKNKPQFRIPAIGLIAMTVAYMIHNAFIFDTSANFLVFFSALGFISFLESQDQPLPAPSPAKPPSPNLVKSVGVVLLIGAVVLAYQTNVRTSLANYAATRGIIASWSNDSNGAVAKFEEADSYNVAGKYDYRNRFAQFLLDYSTTNSIASANITVAFKQAIALEQKNADENPQDYLPELYLSRLNITLGKSDPNSPYNNEALKHSFKALSYSPTFVRTYYEIGQGYLNKKDYPKAEIYFQKAVDLNPTVGISYWYLGAVEMQAGQTDKALADMGSAIKYGYTLSENDYLNLADAYIKRNDFTRLVDVYEGLVKLVPDNAKYHASLATAYAKIGRIDDAVAQARLTVQIDPNFLADAKKFVESLGRQW